MPEITTTVLIDEAENLTSIGGLNEDNTERHLNLTIEPDGNFHKLSVVTTDPELTAAFGEHTECRLPVTVEELRADVQACRAAWRKHVVDRQNKDGLRVFQTFWNFGEAVTNPLDQVLPELAIAGQKLFLAIFRPFEDDTDDAVTRQAITMVLRRFSATRRLRIKITSRTFFAPWNMIYTGDAYRDAIVKEHFWGYQHVIEHVPYRSGNQSNELTQTVPLRLGVYLDSKIDDDLEVECLAPVRKQLATYSEDHLSRIERERKDLLQQTLLNDANDHILYFCCHAEQEGDLELRDRPNRLRLTDPPDDGWITPADIAAWIHPGSLCQRPVVFLNACGGGQFTSTFYRGFGRAFLDAGACSVIGPQTDVPAILGGEFAKRFFTRFFEGGPQNRIADILAEERRKLFDEHRNPLGLLYSLYRGGDIYLRHRLANGTASGVRVLQG